jgi:hypothetical protein
LDYRNIFCQVCSLGFDRIRLCSYWNEIELVDNEFDFTTLDWLLDESHQQGIEVVLTVGMKAPRWLEFHFPDWLSAQQDTAINFEPIDLNPAIADRALRFIHSVVEHTRHAPNLNYWQIENEPFTQLAIVEGRYLSYKFVGQEVELVRRLALPKQKSLMTNAITLPHGYSDEDDLAIQESMSFADAVGVNVYTKVPWGDSSFYLQPLPSSWQKLQAWQQELVTNHKEAWISEAQAEPWEPNQLVALAKARYPSSSPQQTIELVKSLTELGYQTVMLWGCEYWYWQQQHGRNRWRQAVEQLLEA